MKTLFACALLALPTLVLAASEVELGQLAQKKATDPKVRDFGAMMVKDHSAANDDLKALAASKNVNIPEHVSATEEASKTKLHLLSGSAFDHSYVKNQISAHESTVSLLNKEIASGRDPDAKAFAQKVLPTVKSHLQVINQIAAEEGIQH
jgi:putative membrane protein